MGYLLGDPAFDTPPKVNSPSSPHVPRGEAGVVWEVKFLGCNIKAYYDGKNPLGPRQSGVLVVPMDSRGRVKVVRQAWIQSILGRRFRDPIQFEPAQLSVSGWRTMEQSRTPSLHPEWSDDLTGFVNMINSFPTSRLGSEALAEIRTLHYVPRQNAQAAR